MSFEKLKAKSFEEADEKQLVKLVNLVHKKIGDLSGEEAFEYFKLMAWVQNTLIPKVKDNIVGDPVIHEAEKENK